MKWEDFKENMLILMCAVIFAYMALSFFIAIIAG